MTLNEWLKNKWIVAQSTSKNELSNLIHKIDRDILESEKIEISPDWRLAIAYNASLSCATIALRASGYRMPSGTGHHYRTIESLRFTLKPESDLINFLHAICKKRAQVSYDSAGSVTDTEVNEAIGLAKKMKEIIQLWLKQNYPELI